MIKRIVCSLIAALMIIAAVTSCNEAKSDMNDSGSLPHSESNLNFNGDAFPETGNAPSDIVIENESGEIRFWGDKISLPVGVSGVFAEGSFLRITEGGTFVLSGKLDNGGVVVETEKTNEVKLILDGVDITNTEGSPIYVKSCDKIKIVLRDGSYNVLTDGKKYILPNGETKPNACLYSSDDMDIEGNGTLIINANYNNGIGCKNDIDIEGGNIEISAPNNGIKGNDSVSIISGSVKIKNSDDGIKSDNETDSEKGYVSILGGYVDITSDDDAIQAYNSVSITGGTVVTNAGGKAVNCDGSTTLAEGILTEN